MIVIRRSHMKNISQFWQDFNNKNFEQALEILLSADKESQIETLKALYQASSNQKTPFLVSVLRAKLGEDINFEDFYQSWLPPKDTCDPVELSGQTYQQHFKGPVRVMNAINVSDDRDVMSIGLVWAETEADKQATLEFLQNATEGKDEANERRHDSIKEQVPDRELLGIYLTESDDNLGTPF